MPPTPKATIGTPDPDKPFKTIEVLDARTLQVSKVACMSCIRGHRTTSCGIPVCRNKVFWTVKRPGRPSNACNCRYGAGGGCKCVVAKAQACPHKAAKGKGRAEKRAGECRCDEQGRYCCLIEEGDWKVLMALGKPKVEFHTNREALEARFTAAAGTPLSPLSRIDFVPTPFDSIPSTPLQTMASPYTDYHSPRSVLAPRFGMMGLGAPQGSEDVITPDVLAWDGLAPVAPREQSRSCCKGPTSPPQQPLTYDSFSPPPSLANGQQILGSAFDATFPTTTTISSPDPPSQPAFTFSMGDFMASYTAYQFPSAICQTCGLNGCTCRNCPPVMQDTTTGSWAQCCGRKHARTAAYVPAAVEHIFQQSSVQPKSAAAPVSRTTSTTHAHQERHLDGVPGQSVFALSPPQQQVPTRPSQQKQPQLLQDQAQRPYYQEQLFSAAHNNAPIPAYSPQAYIESHSQTRIQQNLPHEAWPADIPSHDPSLSIDFMPFDPGEAFALPTENGDAHGDFFNEYLMADLEPGHGETQLVAESIPGPEVMKQDKEEEEEENGGVDGGCCCRG
ncbi:hypothetical protein LTR78_007763 [Recurvomyces mirabilis]|uniref:Copper-fist domain-containing protein n=1 Tax=Recurvomyces mirabilis TaxID=574656 RepID=A0AAE0TU24_9PEZI|nr:hypothetical protein LTR78_007763 [Recurvomyces mirabilis]KAK5151651.1 hypothetical protein LTS14_009138 [Recurvomyces mirabilis]